MIKVLGIENSIDWDRIVRSFSNYDIYWQSGYVKAFQIHGDGEPQLIYYEDSVSSIRAINVVMKRDIAEDKHYRGILQSGIYYDYSTPYGYGGWLIENPQNECIKGIFDEYEHYCLKENIVSEFVRFHPLVGNHSLVQTYYHIDPLGEVVAIDLASPETIWSNFTSQNRGKIRKAIKKDVRIYQGRYPEIYEIFREIYNSTMDKDHAANYYYFKSEFYESVLNDLPENAQVFYSRLPDGSVIAASIILMANGRMNYHLSGSRREYNDFSPVNMLLYKAALWGYANGYKTLYLGGGVGSAADSLLTFKKAFYRGKLNHFYIGKKIFNAKIYQELVEYRKENCPQIEQSMFFPIYRTPENAEV